MEAIGLIWKPGFRMNADWELAEGNAWRQYFDGLLDGCLFHFGKTHLSLSSLYYYDFRPGNLEVCQNAWILCAMDGGGGFLCRF